MKFTEGYWRLREQFTAAYPVEVLDVATSPETFEVYALTEPMRHRGDLLKGPVITITCSTPMPDVVGVRITHFAGENPKSPSFELETAATEPAPPQQRLELADVVDGLVVDIRTPRFFRPDPQIDA